MIFARLGPPPSLFAYSIRNSQSAIRNPNVCLLPPAVCLLPSSSLALAAYCLLPTSFQRLPISFRSGNFGKDGALLARLSAVLARR